MMSTSNLDHMRKKINSKSPETNTLLRNDFKKPIDMMKTIDINTKVKPKIPPLKIKGLFEIAKISAIKSGSNSARVMYKDTKNLKLKK
jgi:hypothetical protein